MMNTVNLNPFWGVSCSEVQFKDLAQQPNTHLTSSYITCSPGYSTSRAQGCSQQLDRHGSSGKPPKSQGKNPAIPSVLFLSTWISLPNHSLLLFTQNKILKLEKNVQTSGSDSLFLNTLDHNSVVCSWTSTKPWQKGMMPKVQGHTFPGTFPCGSIQHFSSNLRKNMRLQANNCYRNTANF